MQLLLFMLEKACGELLDVRPIKEGRRNEETGGSVIQNLNKLGQCIQDDC